MTSSRLSLACLHSRCCRLPPAQIQGSISHKQPIETIGAFLNPAFVRAFLNVDVAALMKPERSDSGSKQVNLVQSEESFVSRDLSDNEAFGGWASIPFKQSSTIRSISTILAPPRILPIRLTCSEQSTKVY